MPQSAPRPYRRAFMSLPCSAVCVKDRSSRAYFGLLRFALHVALIATSSSFLLNPFSCARSCPRPSPPLSLSFSSAFSRSPLLLVLFSLLLLVLFSLLLVLLRPAVDVPSRRCRRRCPTRPRPGSPWLLSTCAQHPQGRSARKKGTGKRRGREGGEGREGPQVGSHARE